MTKEEYFAKRDELHLLEKQEASPTCSMMLGDNDYSRMARLERECRIHEKNHPDDYQEWLEIPYNP